MLYNMDSQKHLIDNVEILTWGNFFDLCEWPWLYEPLGPHEGMPKFAILGVRLVASNDPCQMITTVVTDHPVFVYAWNHARIPLQNPSTIQKNTHRVTLGSVAACVALHKYPINGSLGLLLHSQHKPTSNYRPSVRFYSWGYPRSAITKYTMTYGQPQCPVTGIEIPNYTTNRKTSALQLSLLWKIAAVETNEIRAPRAPIHQDEDLFDDSKSGWTS